MAIPEAIGARGGVLLRNVDAMIKDAQAVGMLVAAVDPRDECVADVVAREAAIFVEVGDEVIARREALMAAVDAALEAGLLSDAETRLCDLLLGPLLDGFHKSLSEDSPALVKPFQVNLKAEADLSKV